MVKFYAVQIIDAVKKLHQHRVFHKNLNLSNILVGKNGYLKIIGFGFEKESANSKAVCGSLAPEIMKNQ